MIVAHSKNDCAKAMWYVTLLKGNFVSGELNKFFEQSSNIYRSLKRSHSKYPYNRLCGNFITLQLFSLTQEFWFSFWLNTLNGASAMAENRFERYSRAILSTTKHSTDIFDISRLRNIVEGWSDHFYRWQYPPSSDSWCNLLRKWRRETNDSYAENFDEIYSVVKYFPWHSLKLFRIYIYKKILC